MLQLSGAYWLAKCTVTPNLHSSHRARSHFGCFFLFTEYKSLISFSINQSATTKAATISPVFTPVTSAHGHGFLFINRGEAATISFLSHHQQLTASSSIFINSGKRATIFFLSHHQQLTTSSSSTAAGDIALLFSLHHQRLPLHHMAEEAGMFMVHQTIGSVLCCKCGIPMQPNAANMCVKCLRSEVDITEGLKKNVILLHCPECDTYLDPPSTRIRAQLESRELMAFCLKKLKLKSTGVTLVNAEFIWTEPHSKRIKLRVRVQKEVLHGAILEQAYVIEYVQQDQMCDSCTRVQANPDQWVAGVQLRQHVAHRRTFFYLEQLILKHDAAARAIKIKQMDHGIDFFFANRSHGVKFVDFVGKVAPVRSRNDKQLVSHDSKSNNYNYKHTFSVEISPICREDLVCLPPRVAVSLGNLGPLVICSKVTNSIALLDPFTLRHCFLDADQYWRTPFKSLLTSRQLVEYIVFDVDFVSPEVNIGGSRYALADATVARMSDFGKNDTMFNIKTHLGHILKPGDYALGYDLHGANSNDMELDKYKNLVIPEAILVKKSYEEKRQRKRGKPRSWKLKSLNMEVDDTRARGDQEKMNSEYEQFLRDLEENPELRFNVSLYRNKEYQPSEMASMTDGEDIPSIPLEELLADLEINDAEDEDEGMRE